MARRNVLIASLCVTALAWSGLSGADEYRADEFLGLDLSKAVLSPRPLGPATSFAPGPLRVTIDRGSNREPANAEPTAGSKVEIHSARIVHPRAEAPRLVARTKITHHHRNPLDAQALDSRIQVWPCKSGGICNWKR